MATKVQVSTIRVGSQSSYVTYDHYFPITGLVELKKIANKAAILTFDTPGNGKKFSSSMNPRSELTIRKLSEWSYKIIPTSEYKGTEHISDYLMTLWSGNGPPKSGFGYRSYENKNAGNSSSRTNLDFPSLSLKKEAATASVVVPPAPTSKCTSERKFNFPATSQASHQPVKIKAPLLVDEGNKLLRISVSQPKLAPKSKPFVQPRWRY